MASRWRGSKDRLMGLSVLLFILGVTSAAAQAKQDSVPRQLVAAHAALDSGRVEEAITLAERYTSSHDRDPRGFLLLGDAYAARMPAGRFRALEAYRRAKQLAPRDPEPPYRLAQMGLRLGGDAGERIAREGLERVRHRDTGRDPGVADRRAARAEGSLAREFLGAAKPQLVCRNQSPNRRAFREAALRPRSLPAAPSPRLVPPQRARAHVESRAVPRRARVQPPV